MQSRLKTIALLACCLIFLQTLRVAAAEKLDQIDSLLRATYPADEPGAAVIVARKGEVLFRKGYGMASLELKVPIEPDMIFRLGSLTKQFTAAAILMLVQEGRLSLNDEISRFFPDYPEAGRKVTVDQLLTHTSGIKSYTGISSWAKQMREDLTPSEMIQIFRDEPADFAPGEKYLYNNSGYFLLGVIIEKISGLTYPAFIEKRIFEPLGMDHSYYGSHSRVIPRRVLGYQKGPDGFENAPYISMTHPFAAGSLLSSVDDLVKWDAALFSGKVIQRESLTKMLTPAHLNNNAAIRYGYGLGISSFLGQQMFSHSGGIPGFATYALRLPGKDIYIAVLSNNPNHEASPRFVAQQIAAILLGEPYEPPVLVTLDPEKLKILEGRYVSDTDAFAIRLLDGQLVLQRESGPPTPIFPSSETRFFFKNSFTTLSFSREHRNGRKRLTLYPDAGEAEVYEMEKQ